MEEKLEKINQHLEKLETIFSSTSRKLDDRDQLIKEKNERIKELNDKLSSIQQEKNEILQSKIDLMEKYQKEKENTLNKIHEEKIEMQDLKEKIKKLNRGKKTAQDSAMGAGFEQDKLRKELDRREKELEIIEERVAQVASGSTGILFDEESVLFYLKDRISAANRQLRLVVPNIKFLRENNLLPHINELGENTVVNIATAFDLDTDKEIIEEWKALNYRLTDFTDGNLICVSANGADVGISFVKEQKFSGFYTNILDLVSIFNQAIMHAFIKGQKI